MNLSKGSWILKKSSISFQKLHGFGKKVDDFGKEFKDLKLLLKLKNSWNL